MDGSVDGVSVSSGGAVTVGVGTGVGSGSSGGAVTVSVGTGVGSGSSGGVTVSVGTGVGSGEATMQGGRGGGSWCSTMTYRGVGTTEHGRAAVEKKVGFCAPGLGMARHGARESELQGGVWWGTGSGVATMIFGTTAHGGWLVDPHALVDRGIFLAGRDPA